METTTWPPTPGRPGGGARRSRLPEVVGQQVPLGALEVLGDRRGVQLQLRGHRLGRGGSRQLVVTGLVGRLEDLRWRSDSSPRDGRQGEAGPLGGDHVGAVGGPVDDAGAVEHRLDVAGGGGPDGRLEAGEAVPSAVRTRSFTTCRSPSALSPS